MLFSYARHSDDFFLKLNFLCRESLAIDLVETLCDVKQVTLFLSYLVEISCNFPHKTQGLIILFIAQIKVNQLLSDSLFNYESFSIVGLFVEEIHGYRSVAFPL